MRQSVHQSESKNNTREQYLTKLCAEQNVLCVLLQ